LYTILALETSCDETAAAVVRGGRELLANVVSSQMDMHQRYGGIVPEVASRQHIVSLVPVIDEALRALPGGWNDIDAVAATNGPGLSGALLTGLSAAKAIAWQRELPFVGVNHIEAHIYANWLGTGSGGAGEMGSHEPGARETERQRTGVQSRAGMRMSQEPGARETERQGASTGMPFASPFSAAHPSPQFPLIALVVSGGHTLLALLRGHGDYLLLGQTRDDAAGEAFDKVGRILGLSYPGGPAIQKAAEGIQGSGVLPRAWLRDSYDFSFSGLKTAVLHKVQEHQERENRVAPRKPAGRAMAPDEAQSKNPVPLSPQFVGQMAYAFQESVVDVLVTKAIDAAQQFGVTEILLAGGVAANQRLRAELQRRSRVPVRFPPLSLCTDNAAMVAAAAFYRFESGVQSGWDLDVVPNLRLGA
jgi:N6-L-threonylcarbamoyladenine synthase